MLNEISPEENKLLENFIKVCQEDFTMQTSGNEINKTVKDMIVDFSPKLLQICLDFIERTDLIHVMNKTVIVRRLEDKIKNLTVEEKSVETKPEEPKLKPEEQKSFNMFRAEFVACCNRVLEEDQKPFTYYKKIIEEKIMNATCTLSTKVLDHCIDVFEDCTREWEDKYPANVRRFILEILYWQRTKRTPTRRDPRILLMWKTRENKLLKSKIKEIEAELNK